MRSLHIFCILCKDDAVFIPTNITFHRALKNLMPYAQNIKKICINVWCPIYTHFLCHHYPCTVGQNSIFCPLIEFVSKCEFCLILNVSPKMSHKSQNVSQWKMSQKMPRWCLPDVSLKNISPKMSHKSQNVSFQMSHKKCLADVSLMSHLKCLKKCLIQNVKKISQTNVPLKMF